MQADPWPLFHICQYMPPLVPVWTEQIGDAAWAALGPIAAVVAARTMARTPPNSSLARPRRFG
jgi:hypothetical protein